KTSTAARTAGFRACLRCNPDATVPVADPWVEKIRRACVYLSTVDGHPALATLAARLGGSPYHLQRNFKRLVGVSPREYAEACRLGRVKRSLRHADEVTGAMFDAGYGSSSRFYERAAPKLGMAPSIYKRGGTGWPPSRTAKRGRIARWRRPSAARALLARSRARARPTRSRWRFRVIASCRPQAARAGTAGVPCGRRRFSRRKGAYGQVGRVG